MSIEETRIKDLSELPDLRTMKLEPWGLPKNWGYCRGGQHLRDDQWAIKYVHDDLSEDLYPLPDWVTHLIRDREQDARQSLQQQLRNLLSI